MRAQWKWVLAALLWSSSAQSARAQPMSDVVALPAVDERATLAPAVACDGGSVFLIVWQQGRRYYSAQEGDIYGIRAEASGRLLDAAPFAISTAPGSQERPRVAYQDGAFLVVWEDDRHGHLDVYGARVSPAGRVLDPAGLRITEDLASQAGPVVTGYDGRFVVVFQSSASGRYELRATEVSSAGGVTRPDGVALVHEGALLVGGQPDLVAAGSHLFFVVRNDHGWRPGAASGIRWVGELQLNAAGIDVIGLVTLPNGHHFDTAARAGAIGDRWLVTTGGSQRSRRFGYATVLSGLEFVPNPNTELPTSYDADLVMALHAYHNIQGPFAVAGSDEELMVVMRRVPTTGASAEPPAIMMLRIDRNGMRLDDNRTPPVVEEVDGYSPAVGATTGDTFLVAYEVEPAEGATRLHFRVVRPFACAGDARCTTP